MSDVDDDVMVSDDSMEQESVGEEEEAAATTKKSTKKAAAAAAASTKGNKKASPTKRKDAPASDAGNAAKKAKPITNESVAKSTLRTYMKQQNRPYTALVIFENLHHVIKKPTLIKLCDELVEDGDLQMKDFKKTRIYMAKQSDSDTVSPEELDALKSKESVVQDALAEQRARNAQLDSQIRALQNEPSDEELAKQIAQYQKQIDTLNAKLARFKNDKNPVTKEGMNKSQLKFNDAYKAWRTRKRAAEELIEQMCGDEGDPKELHERFRLETDEENGDKIADWRDFVRDIKK